MGWGITISASKPQWFANYTSEATAPRVAKNNQQPGITAFILTYYHPLQVDVASWKFHSRNSMPLDEALKSFPCLAVQRRMRSNI
jgi:hypothetical protein